MTRPYGFAPLALLVAAGLCASAPSPARAQQQPDEAPIESLAADPPAHVSFVDGTAILERDGQPDAAPANMPLLAGDRLRTRDGRVEILFADGSVLHLDANTTLDFQSDELVRLLDGRIRLGIPGPDRRVSYRIDAASASAIISQPGEYRLAVLHGSRENEIELAVIRGAATLENDEGRTALRAGERAFARANAAPSYAYVFNSAAWDSFDRWSEARRDQRLGVSTQYLPDEVRSYGPSFDQYGAWRYDAAYGYVWYPRVAVDWRPYYRGRWVTLRPYGWTWIGSDPWAWPTHHYGRWGLSAGAWFWIPGRSWAPAWVSWAYAPGYVSWCPLGWNNRAVLQINVNLFGRGYDPWRAWTAVPRQRFGVDYVNVHYVAGRTFDARTRGAFVPRYSAPEIRGYAVPRSTAPIRTAGSPAPRRSTAPIYTNLEPGASRVGSGGQRVMVGPSRGSVAESPAPRADRTDAGGARGDRNVAGPGMRQAPEGPTYRDPGRRAVPRDQPAGAAPRPGDRTYRSGPDSSVASPSRAGDAPDPRYRENPYARRAPDRSDGRAEPPARYEPYGRAMPRSADAPRPAPEPRTFGMPSPTPEPSRPPAPESRPYGGIERRGPANDRPSGPPPDSARPGPRERSNPGNDRAAPGDGHGSPGQARPRPGGQPSSGTAVRRGGR